MTALIPSSALPQKSKRAPTARDIKARGKREAKRSASPLVSTPTKGLGLKGRNTHRITPFSGLDLNFDSYQGRRASRLPLAFISRAVGAVLRLLGQSRTGNSEEFSLRRSEMSQFLRHRWRSFGARSVDQPKL